MSDDLEIGYADSLAPLAEALEGVNRPGDYVAAGVIETAMPLLRVEGVGTVSFPVPPEQSRKLIEAAAEKAPYGRGAETLVDESVRKVWQISPSRVDLGGKAWGPTLERLVGEVVEGLGCGEARVAAEFYKLLIYEEGGFFLPHRDSEKAGGMFGTLVVSLPSEHAGGELIVRHAGREKRFDLRVSDPAEIRYAAFYADCEHEVKPIESGYRICLIYNLVQRGKGENRLLPPEHGPAVEAATRILRAWREAGSDGGEFPVKLAYLLEHGYTTAALSFSGLKGGDAAVAKVLRRAAAEAGFALHLGIVHIEESGWAEYGGYWEDNPDDNLEVGEVDESYRYIAEWRDVEDRAAGFGKIPLVDGEVLPVGALDGEDADEVHFSEATGNAGASFERTYLRAALVLWPRENSDAVCASGGIEAAVARLGQRVEEENAGDAVRELARRVVGSWPQYGDHSGTLTAFLEHLARFGDGELIREVAEEPLLASYDGSQNGALAKVAAVAGAEAAAGVVNNVVRRMAIFIPAACMDLWARLSEGRLAESEGFLDEALQVLLERIRKAKPVNDPGYPYQLRERKATELSVDSILGFFRAIAGSRCAGSGVEAARAIAANPAVFTPEEHLIDVLATGAEADFSPEVEAVLWRHCAEYFLKRSEYPPEEPGDWAQAVTVARRVPILLELEKFARDPGAQEHRFRAPAGERMTVEHTVREMKLDMTCVTESKGRPYTLICTKNRASHQRACAQHREDVGAMRRLLELAPSGADGDELCERLRAGIGRG